MCKYTKQPSFSMPNKNTTDGRNPTIIKRQRGSGETKKKKSETKALGHLPLPWRGPGEPVRALSRAHICRARHQQMVGWKRGRDRAPCSNPAERESTRACSSLAVCVRARCPTTTTQRAPSGRKWAFPLRPSRGSGRHQYPYTGFAARCESTPWCAGGGCVPSTTQHKLVWLGAADWEKRSGSGSGPVFGLGVLGANGERESERMRVRCVSDCALLCEDALGARGALRSPRVLSLSSAALSRGRTRFASAVVWVIYHQTSFSILFKKLFKLVERIILWMVNVHVQKSNLSMGKRCCWSAAGC